MKDAESSTAPEPRKKDAESNTEVTLSRTMPVIWQCHIDGPTAEIDEPDEDDSAGHDEAQNEAEDGGDDQDSVHDDAVRGHGDIEPQDDQSHLVHPDLREVWRKFRAQMADEKKTEESAKKSVDPRPNHKGRLRKRKTARAKNLRRGADKDEDRGKKMLAIADCNAVPMVEEVVTPKGKRKIKKDVNDSPGTFDFEQLENAEMESEQDEGIRKEKAFRRGNPDEEKKVLEDMQIVSDEVDRIDRPLDSMLRAVSKSTSKRSKALKTMIEAAIKATKKGTKDKHRPVDAAATEGDKSAKGVKK